MRLHRLASGSSLAVLAAMLGTQPVLGAAYQGNPTTTLGSVSYDRATLNVDTITVDSAQATINWTPTDTGIGGGGITFLANTGTANYVAGSNAAGGYTVLNRIIAADPSRSIVLDGAVNSAAGGSVWFYAPGGILVGQNARFNVGSLLLSASDPVTGGGGQFLTGGSFSVAGVAGSQASVLIAPGGADQRTEPGQLCRRCRAADQPGRRDPRQRLGGAGRGRKRRLHLQWRPVRHHGDAGHHGGRWNAADP